MKHYLVLAAALIAAAAFYVTGSVTGALVLTGIGVVLELFFWAGLLRKHRGRARPV